MIALKPSFRNGARALLLPPTIRDNLGNDITEFQTDCAKPNIISKKRKKLFKKALTNFSEYDKTKPLTKMRS